MVLPDNQTLFNAIAELGIIDTDVLQKLLHESTSRNISLASLLVERDLIGDQNLGKTMADIMSLPFVTLSSTSIENEVLRLIPQVVARKQKAITFKSDEKGVHVATSDPSNIEFIELLKKKIGDQLILYYSTERDIQEALAFYNKDVTQVFDTIIAENIKESKGLTEDDPPIIKIVDSVLGYAYENKASDIHLEPQESQAVVRFRIDGMLHDIIQLPQKLYPQVVTRIKVLSNLRTDEHQAPQDGKLQHNLMADGTGETMDVRVSIVPITYGEKIVMRLLSAKSRQYSLTDLGLTEEDLVKVTAAYKKPYGMILATGPTGSGKTTTMYAILKLLNTRDVNIMTIEDPVEYEVDGVNQIQVNQKTGLTFATGLRSIVRQDPNIILVGEIRDEETANIAVNSAMTGHLVLSTLHTNDASTTIPRLLDMGIQPFLLSSSTHVIVAQRLVRKICSKCRISFEPTAKELKALVSDNLIKKYFPDPTKDRLYKGKGCPVCHNTGYIGRVGIFEVLTMDDDIRQAIDTHEDASVISQLAIKKGMRTMLEDGVEKVKLGITTLEEVIRVTKE